MEIPKNTTQMGEVRGNYKIFIEDYVISYIKQLCRNEPDSRKRIALYGVTRTEKEQQYFFIYGGSQIPIHGKNDYFMTSYDYEEMVWTGEKYFDAYVSLGFVNVEDELPEGVFLFWGGKQIYVQGYHIFYEKNDSMLAFMINNQETMQGQQNVEENVIEEAYEEAEYINEPVVMEKRQYAKEKNSDEEIKLFGVVKSVAAALLIVLCVTAISTINGLGKIENTQNFFQKAFHAMKEKKIPDKEEVLPASIEVEIPGVSSNETVSGGDKF